jgi:chromosome segregation ATPase
MKRQAVADLSSVIRENTERRSIEELAAKGKRHFRVVSGDKVLRLIQAVVDDTIQREAGELAARDRDRLVQETRQEFDRVLRIQTEQDATIRRHRELADYFRQQAEQAEERIASLKAELRESRRRTDQQAGELATCFERERLELKAEYEGRIMAVREETEDVRSRLAKAEQRLANARETIESYDREFERVTRELEAERDRLTAALAAGPDLSRARDQANRVKVKSLEDEVRVLTRRLAATQHALARSRREVGDAGAPVAPEIRSELQDLREMVSELASRPAAVDASAISLIVERLSERDKRSTEELENRFRENMENTLAEVTRALQAATARPVDFAVEATDVLIDRLFDEEHEMGTNLDALAVQELKSAGQDIAGNLERLRRARGQTGDGEASDT